MAAQGAAVAHCPLSNAYFAVSEGSEGWWWLIALRTRTAAAAAAVAAATTATTTIATATATPIPGRSAASAEHDGCGHVHWTRHGRFRGL